MNNRYREEEKEATENVEQEKNEGTSSTEPDKREEQKVVNIEELKKAQAEINRLNDLNFRHMYPRFYFLKNIYFTKFIQ